MSKKFNNIPLPENIILKDYTIIKRISSGGFSFVYLAKNNLTNEIVAIKEYMPNSNKIRTKGREVYIPDEKERYKFSLGLEQFFNEMSIISHIQHHNIINILDYFEMNNTAYIVTPYEYGIPLAIYINNMKKYQINITENELLKIMLGIMEAIEELHNNNILHLDLKPPNIWLRPNNEVLILDFGASLETHKVRTKQHFFTHGFAATEQYKQNTNPLDINVWTDYYGIGTTLYMLLTKDIPPKSIDLMEMEDNLDINKFCSGMYHYKILDTINQLCTVEVEKRKKMILSNMIKEIKNIIPFNQKIKNIKHYIFN